MALYRCARAQSASVCQDGENVAHCALRSVSRPGVCVIDSRRRQLLRAAALGGLGLGCGRAAFAALAATPSETAGPFYPVRPQPDTDFDLTRVAGRRGVAAGPVVRIVGRVLGTDGAPLPGAVVDLWQANAAGRYRHPRDPNPAPLDADFQGWAVVAADAAGGFAFRTVVPGAYPASRDWMRPPHIHFKISGDGHAALTTQMYFPDSPLNARDRLLMRKTAAERARMVATAAGVDAQGVRVLNYTVVLARR